MSCQKDKIHIWDKNNDCDNCKVYYENLDGGTSVMTKEQIAKIVFTPAISSYCDYLKSETKNNKLLSASGLTTPNKQLWK